MNFISLAFDIRLHDELTSWIWLSSSYALRPIGRVRTFPKSKYDVVHLNYYEAKL